MKHRSLFSTVSTMLALAVLLSLGSRAQAIQKPETSQENQSQSSFDSAMMNHQQVMADLLAEFQENFAAVVNSKDAYGNVRDKAAIMAYEGDLNALREALRQHKQLAADSGGRCGLNPKRNVMTEHQQRMKTALYELTSTFGAYVAADDHGIDQPYMVEESLNAYRDALQDFAAVVHEHGQEVAAMMAANATHPMPAIRMGK